MSIGITMEQDAHILRGKDEERRDKMTDRMCSCCGQLYTDEVRHDYETCVKNCEEQVEKARYNLSVARECLEMAISRRQAQREGRIK